MRLRAVAVLSSDVALSLFGSTEAWWEKPFGANQVFRVIGVLETKAAALWV
jgi:hypothetical protein